MTLPRLLSSLSAFGIGVLLAGCVCPGGEGGRGDGPRDEGRPMGPPPDALWPHTATPQPGSEQPGRPPREQARAPRMRGKMAPDGMRPGPRGPGGPHMGGPGPDMPPELRREAGGPKMRKDPAAGKHGRPRKHGKAPHGDERGMKGPDGHPMPEAAAVQEIHEAMRRGMERLERLEQAVKGMHDRGGDGGTNIMVHDAAGDAHKQMEQMQQMQHELHRREERIHELEKAMQGMKEKMKVMSESKEQEKGPK